MSKEQPIKAAIVDHGLGNLFSVQQACHHVGMEASITPSSREILAADVVILPGVGAFEDAMQTLHKLDLVRPLQDIAASGKILVGVCLGLQLLMSESHEFGVHKGLGIIEGPVVRFKNPVDSFGLGESRRERKLKVPQIGWNAVCCPATSPTNRWADTPLKDLREGDTMYFVHSYYAKPEDKDALLAVSDYGGIEFCSAIHRGNLFAFQFHPERSGPHGLQIYRNIANMVLSQRTRNIRDS